MKKILTILLFASLFIVTACTNTDDTDTTDTTNTTTQPVSQDEKAPIKLSNYRLVSEFVDKEMYISVDVEINFEDMLPDYQLSLTNPIGETVPEFLQADDNPEKSSCNLSISNANLESNTIKCNSMFEISGDGTYTINVMDADNRVLTVIVEITGNTFTVTEQTEEQE